MGDAIEAKIPLPKSSIIKVILDSRSKENHSMFLINTYIINEKDLIL